MVTKVLAEGKGVIARWGLKEAGVQSCEPTCLRPMHRHADEMSYKAEHPGVSQSLKIERVCEEENINSHELRMGSCRRPISQVRAQTVHLLSPKPLTGQ
jgi:hypothetical protein